MKIVTVNQDTCIGCGTCPALCSTSFTIDPTSGKASVINPTGNTEAELDSAIASCPTQSISWVEQA